MTQTSAVVVTSSRLSSLSKTRGLGRLLSDFGRIGGRSTPARGRGGSGTHGKGRSGFSSVGCSGGKVDAVHLTIPLLRSWPLLQQLSRTRWPSDTRIPITRPAAKVFVRMGATCGCQATSCSHVNMPQGGSARGRRPEKAAFVMNRFPRHLSHGEKVCGGSVANKRASPRPRRASQAGGPRGRFA